MDEGEGDGQMKRYDDMFRQRLRRDLERVPVPDRNLRRAILRGRRIRALRRSAFAALAVLAFLVGVFVGPNIDLYVRPASQGKLPAASAQDSTWQSDRAASFAVRAIAHAGLLDPTGDLYSYEGIHEAQGEWTVTFQVWDCAQSVELGRCLESPSDATLTVRVEEGRLVVSEAVGPIDDSSRDRLAQYDEAFEPEAARFEFPYVEVTHFKGGSIGLQGSPLWTGPIPYVAQDGSDEIGKCEAEIRNSSGEVVYRGSAGGGKFVPLTVPATEELRAGGLSGVPIPAALAQKSGRVRIVCEVGDAGSLGP